MTEQILQNYIDDTAATLRTYKGLAEKAMAQVSDEEFFRAIDGESNSIAVIAKHIGGNLRSRWTNFLTTDGEKPYRHRDSEFVAAEDTRESLMEFWENGWQTLFLTLESLQPDDLSAIVKIRGEDHTVVKAMNRSLAHTCSHVGQIVFLAKHLHSKEWKTLSIPKNKSVEFNAFLDEQKKEGASKMTFTEWHENFEEKMKREES